MSPVGTSQASTSLLAIRDTEAAVVVRPSTASRARPSVRRSYSRASNNAAQNVQQHSPVRRRRRRGNSSGTGPIRPQRSSSRDYMSFFIFQIFFISSNFPIQFRLTRQID